MGYVDGRVRNFGWRVSELRARTECEPGYSGRCVCARMSSASGAVNLCHHFIAGKNSERTRYDPQSSESFLTGPVYLRRLPGNTPCRRGIFLVPQILQPVRPTGAIIGASRPGVVMHRFHLSALLIGSFCSAILCSAQDVSSSAPQSASTTSQAQSSDSSAAANSAPETPEIPADAPHMSKQTRLEIIRDFEAQLVYSRALFPMGAKGLALKDGVTTPNGQNLQQLLALWGPSIKPGDPAHISYVRIHDNHIHFDLNGGPVHRKKWYQHIEVSGTGGASVPLSRDESTDNPHGSYLDLYFDKYVPEMSAAQLRVLLYPALDFKAKNKEEAYLDTVPPKVKEAIQAHHVL